MSPADVPHHRSPCVLYMCAVLADLNERWVTDKRPAAKAKGGRKEAGGRAGEAAAGGGC